MKHEIDSKLHKQSAVQERLTLAQVVSSNPQTNVAPSTKPYSRDEEIANLNKLNEELLKKLTPPVATPDPKDEIIDQRKQENANLDKKSDLLTETIKSKGN